MINMSMMGDDFLDDRRPDFRLWWWRGRGWQRSLNRGFRALAASNNDLVFDDFARWLGGFTATDYELFMLSCNQLSADSWGRQAPLTATNDYRVFLSITLPAVATLFTVFVAEGYLFALLTSGVFSFSEPDLVSFKLDLSWSGRSSSTTERDLLDFALTSFDGRCTRS